MFVRKEGQHRPGRRVTGFEFTGKHQLILYG